MKIDKEDIIPLLIIALICSVGLLAVGYSYGVRNAADCRPDSDEKVGHVYYSGECHVHPKKDIAS